MPVAGSITKSKQWILKPKNGKGHIAFNRYTYVDRPTIQNSWGSFPHEKDPDYTHSRSGTNLCMLHTSDRALLLRYQAERFDIPALNIYAELVDAGLRLHPIKQLDTNERDNISARLGCKLGEIWNAMFEHSEDSGAQINLLPTIAKEGEQIVIDAMKKVGQTDNNIFTVSPQYIVEFVPRNMPADKAESVREKIKALQSK